MKTNEGANKLSQAQKMQLFGRKLRRIRRERGVSVRQIMEHLGLGSMQSVYRYEAGYSYPAADRLIQLADLLGVEPKTLFTYRDFIPRILTMNKPYWGQIRKQYLTKGIKFRRPIIVSHTRLPFVVYNKN